MVTPFSRLVYASIKLYNLVKIGAHSYTSDVCWHVANHCTKDTSAKEKKLKYIESGEGGGGGRRRGRETETGRPIMHNY